MPRSENKNSILGGNLITSRIPAPKKETIKMQITALIATISDRGKRSLKSFINASLRGIIAIPKANKNTMRLAMRMNLKGVVLKKSNMGISLTEVQ